MSDTCGSRTILCATGEVVECCLKGPHDGQLHKSVAGSAEGFTWLFPRVHHPLTGSLRTDEALEVVMSFQRQLKLLDPLANIPTPSSTITTKRTIVDIAFRDCVGRLTADMTTPEGARALVASLQQQLDELDLNLVASGEIDLDEAIAEAEKRSTEAYTRWRALCDAWFSLLQARADKGKET